MFSSRSFIVSGLTFRSLIHFQFFFVYGVRKCSNFILLHVAVQFSQGVPLSVSYYFAFWFCSWDSQGKNTEVVCIPFPIGPHSVRPPPWPVHLGWPHTAWLSFTELDKAVVHVIRLANFLWLWFQCVCPLMPYCNTYHLTWVSLKLGHGVSLHSCSSKAQPLPFTLDEGYLLTAAPPDLECGVAPLGPPAPVQP